MKTKTIHNIEYNNQLYTILVDLEADINEDYIFDTIENSINVCENKNQSDYFNAIKKGQNTGHLRYKIIAASPKLGELPELPDWKNEVDLLNPYKIKYSNRERAWREGYQKAKETYKFSEEDLISFAKLYHQNKNSIDYISEKELLNNFNQSKELEFEVEMEDSGLDKNILKESGNTRLVSYLRPKIINNVIQGKWINN